MDESTKRAVTDTIEQTVEAAAEVVRHPFVKRLAQLGFYTKGFLFIVIGMLAVLVALGDKGEALADPSGALQRIARAPYGKWILIVFIVGAIGHGIWNILRGAADVDNAGKSAQGVFKRILAASVGFFYLFLAWTAWGIILSARVAGGNGTIQKTLTATLLAFPLGALLVGLIGLSVIGAGVHECYSGVTGKFQEAFRLRELKGINRIFFTTLGFLSFLSRGLIFGLIGYFFIMAAIDSNANEAVGLDGALLTLAQSYFGKTVLFVTAAGLVCHGVLSLYEARYRRIC
ncbi:MAG: DUF1206 domain-containing protein [Acidobacteriota bacterium]|nr:DUF1206 domain-containing protein [Acidobacteriota bacterium]